MQPGFKWKARDYGLRDCDATGAKLTIDHAKGWVVLVNDRKVRPGKRAVPIAASPDEAIAIGFKRRKHKAVRHYHLRCLPSDFPAYTFERTRKGGNREWSQQLGSRYGAIFDSNGAPIWWTKAGGEPDNIEILADGTIAYAPVEQAADQVGDYDVRNLRGRLLHHFTGAGNTTVDVHDLRLLPNGDYMMGAQAFYRADTSAYNGVSDGRVTGIEIQEYKPNGHLVYKLGFARSHRTRRNSVPLVGRPEPRQPALRHRPLERRRGPRQATCCSPSGT